MFQYYFDNTMWLWLWNTFTISLMMIPGLVAAILKLIAIRHPEVPTDEIMGLVKVIFTRPNNPNSAPEPEQDEGK